MAAVPFTLAVVSFVLISTSTTLPSLPSSVVNAEAEPEMIASSASLPLSRTRSGCCNLFTKEPAHVDGTLRNVDIMGYTSSWSCGKIRNATVQVPTYLGA